MAKEPVANAGQKTRKKREPVDPNETPRQRFQRVGGSRVGTALQKIRLLGNITAKTYEYTAADVDRVEAALSQAVKDATSAMRAGLNVSGGARAAAPKFTF